MNVFLDSSALVKRYIEEAGSNRVDDILASASAVGASVLAPTEVISALCRRRRETRLSARQYAGAKRALASDLADVTLIGISEDVIRIAISAIQRWPLRSADALHVACAAAWSADLFVTADETQLRAARGSGLSVETLTVN